MVATESKQLKAILFAPISRIPLVLGSILFLILLARTFTKAGDFSVYFAAGYRFLNGFSVHVIETNVFTYPTFTAVLMAPLTWFGYDAAKLLFFALNFAGFIIGLRLLSYYLLPQSLNSERRLCTQIVFWLSCAICLRYFLSVFDNQQTDFLVFGTVLLGLHYYQQGQHQFRSAGFWALAALLKANPLFMIVLPAIQKRWIVLFAVIGLFSAGLFLPDLIKPATDIEAGDSVTVPRVIIEREGRDNAWQYALNPLQESSLPYLREYLDLTFDSDAPKWWQDSGNRLNQSVTIASIRWLPKTDSASYIAFLFWCAFFSSLIALAAHRGRSPFALGVLCYAAFVLIGPMASKPHFVAFSGVWMLALQNVSSLSGSKRILHSVFLACLAILFGFSSSGIMGDWALELEARSNIALSGLLLWIYCVIQKPDTSITENETLKH